MPTGARGDGKMILPIHLDAAHDAEQPVADRTLGVVIQRRRGGGVGAFPVFPNRRSALLGHTQPAGQFLVFQQAVSILQVNIRQYIQNERR